MKIFSKLCVLFLSILAVTSLDASDVVVTGKSNFSKSVDWFPTFPQGALNTDTGETLIVWEDGIPPGSQAGVEGITLYGRIINPKGKATKKIPSIPADVEQMADVAYNPVTHEYLVVFDRQCCIKDAPSPSDSIHALRLDSQLNPIGKEFELIQTTETDRMTSAYVLFNPKTQGYTLFWEDWDRSETVGTKDSGIHAVQLDQSGKIAGKSIFIAKNPGSSDFYDNVCCGRILDLVMLPKGKILILFRQRTAADRVELRLTRVDPLLKKVKTKKFASHSIDPQGGPNYPKLGGSLAVLQDGSGLLYYVDDEGLKKRTFNAKGKLSPTDSAAFSASFDAASLYDPTVAFSTTSNGVAGLLMATEQRFTGGTAWGQVLDSKGEPVGAPVEVNQAPDNTVTGFGSFLMALPRGASDTRFEFVWLQTLGGYEEEKTISRILKLKLDVQP